MIKQVDVTPLPTFRQSLIWLLMLAALPGPVALTICGECGALRPDCAECTQCGDPVF